MRTLRLSLFALIGIALPAFAQENSYVQTNLVSDNPDFNPQIVDPNMIDAWGLALRPPGAGGHIWISNAMTGTSSEFIGDVNGIPLHQDGLKLVDIDEAGFADLGHAFVTGQVYNAASDFAGQPVEFAVSGPAQNLSTDPPTTISGGTSGSAKFIFVTEDGVINAWRSNTATAMTSAKVVIDYSKTANYFPYPENSVFSGVAMTTNAASSAAYINAGGNHLFTTDFRHNAIEVFDNQWHDVTGSYHFQTPASIGSLHAFNVQDIAGHLFVTYADWNPDGDEGMEQNSGPGLGHVVEYSEDGSMLRDFDATNALNSPWGVAIAPGTFGRFANDLLVANFGDGTISAFDPATGAFLDDLRDPDGNIISIDGIWALAFGNGVSLGDAGALYFTAGPNAEQNGLFGRLNVEAVPEPGTVSLVIVGLGAVVWSGGALRRPARTRPL